MESIEKAQWALAWADERSVLVPHGCRLWLRALNHGGYGKAVITRSGVERTVRVHRWLYEQVTGPDPLPEDVVIAHEVCNETLCLNVHHLRAVTQAVNLRQMAQQGRSAGRAHGGLSDTRGPLGRARAIQAALHDGLDLDRLAAAMREGDPRPLVRAALARGYDAEAYLTAVEASDPSRNQLLLF